jgi:hypothetical protein
MMNLRIFGRPSMNERGITYQQSKVVFSQFRMHQSLENYRTITNTIMNCMEQQLETMQGFLALAGEARFTTFNVSTAMRISPSDVYESILVNEEQRDQHDGEVATDVLRRVRPGRAAAEAAFADQTNTAGTANVTELEPPTINAPTPTSPASILGNHPMDNNNDDDYDDQAVLMDDYDVPNHDADERALDAPPPGPPPPAGTAPGPTTNVNDGDQSRPPPGQPLAAALWEGYGSDSSRTDSPGVPSPCAAQKAANLRQLLDGYGSDSSPTSSLGVLSPCTAQKDAVDTNTTPPSLVQDLDGNSLPARNAAAPPSSPSKDSWYLSSSSSEEEDDRKSSATTLHSTNGPPSQSQAVLPYASMPEPEEEEEQDTWAGMDINVAVYLVRDDMESFLVSLADYVEKHGDPGPIPPLISSMWDQATQEKVKELCLSNQDERKPAAKDTPNRAKTTQRNNGGLGNQDDRKPASKDPSEDDRKPAAKGPSEDDRKPAAKGPSLTRDNISSQGDDPVKPPTPSSPKPSKSPKRDPPESSKRDPSGTGSVRAVGSPDDDDDDHDGDHQDQDQKDGVGEEEFEDEEEFADKEESADEAEPGPKPRDAVSYWPKHDVPSRALSPPHRTRQHIGAIPGWDYTPPTPTASDDHQDRDNDVMEESEDDVMEESEEETDQHNHAIHNEEQQGQQQIRWRGGGAPPKPMEPKGGPTLPPTPQQQPLARSEFLGAARGEAPTKFTLQSFRGSNVF